MRALVGIRRISTALSIAVLLIASIIGGALWFAASDAGLRWVSDEAAARRFFESTFVPYALVSSESGDTGELVLISLPRIS